MTIHIVDFQVDTDGMLTEKDECEEGTLVYWCNAWIRNSEMHNFVILRVNGVELTKETVVMQLLIMGISGVGLDNNFWPMKTTIE